MPRDRDRKFWPRGRWRGSTIVAGVAPVNKWVWYIIFGYCRFYHRFQKVYKNDYSHFLTSLPITTCDTLFISLSKQVVSSDRPVRRPFSPNKQLKGHHEFWHSGNVQACCGPRERSARVRTPPLPKLTDFFGRCNFRASPTDLLITPCTAKLRAHKQMRYNKYDPGLPTALNDRTKPKMLFGTASVKTTKDNDQENDTRQSC